MKVELLVPHRVERAGKLERLPVGTVLNVGKSAAWEWSRQGIARILDVDAAKGNTRLIRQVREFQFAQAAQKVVMRVGGEDVVVTREQVHEYGGPDPRIVCSDCQRMEWLSRLRRKNQFVEHGCAGSETVHNLCQNRGDEWSHHHQCFLYAAHVSMDEKFRAPHCLMIQPQKGVDFMNTRNNDPHTQVFLRQMAQVCVYDVIVPGQARGNARYDFAYLVNNGEGVTHPTMPVVMYGHDLWKRRARRQWLLKSIEPEILWTPFYASWTTHFQIPQGTEVRFRPVPASRFYTRSDLIHKDCDLLSIGATASPIYGPRKRLASDLAVLDGKYTLRFHHAAGASRSRSLGANNGETPYGSGWSRFLSRARYVIFGPIAEEPQPVFFKYYEVLGSGAVPIMPHAPDLDRLGLEPWVHYVPLDHVWEQDQGLHRAAIDKLLRDYDKHFQIAANAAQWFEDEADGLLFGSVADLVRTITQERFPLRREPGVPDVY